MIIDAHAHGFCRDHLDKLEGAGGDWAGEILGHLYKGKPHLFDVGLRLEMLDRNGIDLQVVTPINYVDCNLLPGDARAQLVFAQAINDNMAKFMDLSKGRLLPVGNIPLVEFEKGGLKELDRTIKELGLKAVSVPTNVRGKPLDLPEFEPFWARVAEGNVPVYIHPVPPVTQSDRSYEKDYGLTHNFGWPFETMLTLCRLVFSRIMAKYPTLKIISHHLGGGLPFYWGRMSETYSNLKDGEQRDFHRSLPKPLFHYFSTFYYDTAIGGSGPAIKCAYEVFGADHLVFATDAPWGAGTGEFRLASYPKVIKDLGFSEADNEKIFEGNIRKVLNL